MRIGVGRKKIRMGDLLVAAGAITEDQLQEALVLQKEKGQKLGKTLLESGIISKELLIAVLTQQLGVEYIELKGCKFDDEVLSLIPGTSRSGVTTIGGLLLGYDRNSSAEYSFFLSVPIMFAAAIYKLIKYAFNFKIFTKEVIILVTAMLVAMLTSLIVIKKLVNYIKNHGFKVFGIYRIILGVFILIMWLI